MGNSLSIVLTYRLHEENATNYYYERLKEKCRKKNICNNVNKWEICYQNYVKRSVIL